MKRPRTLAGRMFVWQLAVVLLILAALGLVLDRVLERNALSALEASLVSEARTVQQSIADDPQPLEPFVRAMGTAGGVRVTVVASDGTVMADSEHDPATMENHAGRPEIRSAISGHIGIAARRSTTIGTDFLYVALPPSNDRVVRVAVPLTQVRSRQRTVRIAIVAGMFAAALASAGGVLFVSRGVSRPLRHMTDSLGTLGGEPAAPGRLTQPLVEGGPEEVRLLAATLNDMAERITDQVRSSRQAQAERDLILSSMKEGVLLAGADGAVNFANSAMERHLGSRPDRVSQIGPTALRQATEGAGRGSSSILEVETGNPPRWLEASAVPVGEAGAVLLVVRDSTESKRLEAVRRDLVANASHELKSPVAAIRAGAETILSAAEEDPEAVPRFAGQLESDAIRLSRIISDLLDLSRLESGSELDETVPMDQLVLEEAGQFRDGAAERGLTLTIMAEPVLVNGSERDLRLLIRNLVDNAVRYAKDSGEVQVRVWPENGLCLLHVLDTGVGIPTKDLPRIFERFYRVDRARSRETGGTGLGLSIVKHVAENHAGSVSVTSELGSGSTFEVRLPRA